MPRVSLRQIADAVGCTRSTVSYALRDHPSISEKTRRRVQAAARDLGWRRDATLQQHMALVRTALVRNDLPNLGVLFNRTKQELARLPTIRRHLEGVVRRVEEMGFSANLFNLADQALSARRLASVMRARGIRALVLVDPELSLPREYLELSHEFAAVSIGVDPEGFPVHVAISDYLSLGRRAVRELAQAGFSRPGMVLPRGTEDLLHYGFTGGFCAGIARLPPADQLPICYCTKDMLHLPREVFGEIRAWIDAHRPDVLLGIDTRGLAECLETGPRRHADLPIYSLDWHPGEGAVGGIDQRAEAIGRAGVNLIVSRLDRREAEGIVHKLTVLVEERWVQPSGRRTMRGAARRRAAAGAVTQR